MRFMWGIVIAGIIVIVMNIVFVTAALNVDDDVVASYETEAR